MLVVSESGLYALIFKSRKPQAKAFRKWVTSEVLPAIRRTGSYSPEPEVTPETDIREAVEWAVLGVRNGTVTPAQATAIFTGARLLGGISGRINLIDDEERREMASLMGLLASPVSGQLVGFTFAQIVETPLLESRSAGIFPGLQRAYARLVSKLA